MKVIFLCAVLIGSTAHSLEIHNVNYDKAKDKLLIDMSYIGGCETNSFKLILAKYNKTAPPQIEYRIQISTPDTCKKQLRTIEPFNVPNLVRNGDAFTIVDDLPPNQSRTGQRSLCIPKCGKQKKDELPNLLKKFQK